jgi:DNA polymerase-3 subunit delta'
VETAVAPFAEVVGQERAVAQLRAAVEAPVHAYLLVGPQGWGARALARGLAAGLLVAGLGPDDAARTRRLALAEHHADLVVVEPEGNQLRKPEAQDLIRLAHRSPVEGHRKVILGTGFGKATAEAAAMLLKVIEEPPASTVFVLLADELIPELVTIASRCTTVELDPVPDALLAARLVDEGAEPAIAERAARAAGGDLDRARALVGDERLAVRLDAWSAVAVTLDGTGHTAWRLVGELQAAVVDALAHHEAGHKAELEALGARTSERGERGSAAKVLVEHHKRALRRARTLELRLGLATLAARYRDALVAGVEADRAALVGAVAAVDAAVEALMLRNPNETLLLQALLLRLPTLR